MQLLVKDVAQLLNVDEKTIYRWIRQQSIPVYHINEQYRFNQVEILEWATGCQIPIAANFAAPSNGSSVPMPGLLDALNVGGIIYGLEGSDKSAVLHHLVDAMPLPATVDREFLYQVMLARENLGSTGIGDGIAIPHVRNPIVLHITQPTICLCFLKEPIDFGSVDGRPVNILFSLICPTVRIHIHLLARLGFVLRNPLVKEALEKQLVPKELMAIFAKVEKEISTKHDEPFS